MCKVILEATQIKCLADGYIKAITVILDSPLLNLTVGYLEEPKF